MRLRPYKKIEQWIGVLILHADKFLTYALHVSAWVGLSIPGIDRFIAKRLTYENWIPYCAGVFLCKAMDKGAFMGPDVQLGLLHVALARHEEALLDAVLARGQADLNAKSAFGDRALHEWSRTCTPLLGAKPEWAKRILGKLLDHGADITLLNNAEQSVFEAARRDKVEDFLDEVLATRQASQLHLETQCVQAVAPKPIRL